MKRRRTFGALLARALLIAAILSLLAAGAWVYARGWAPSREDYPVQGVSVSAADGQIDWGTLSARQADFAYVRATSGATGRDPAFAANWAGARQVGLRYGASHDFSLCHAPADQATMFLSTVPRDNAALPPVVRLAFDPACVRRPGRDALLSDLNTFLNIIEAHSGKPAILRVSPDVEDHYALAEGINRTLWLERNFLAPDYASRPWVMWTASDLRRLDGVEAPVEWTVVAP